MAANKPAPRLGPDKREARLPLVAAPRLVPAAGYRATLRSVLVGPSVTPRIMRSPGILVFDSGVGGLTVFREIARARPDARLAYATDDEEIGREIEPCFVQDGSERTDTIVLACTHYPLLLNRFERLAPWPVRWIDPAAAIARRVLELIGPPADTAAPANARAIFTSG